MIKQIGKPVAKAVLSHEHPDHWSGAVAMPDLPFETLPAIRADVVQEAGDRIPANVANSPDLVLGHAEIDGVPIEFRNITHTESNNMIVAVLPEQRVAVVQDLVFSGVYFAPGYDRPKWIRDLESFRDDPAFDTLLLGHGTPSNRGELDVAIQYLKLLTEVMDGPNATPEKAVKAMQDAYPSYLGADFVLKVLIPEYWPS